MKIYRVIFIAVIAAGILSARTHAQKNWAQEADKAFTYFQYYEAVGMYKKAQGKIKKNKLEKARVIFQIAECYRLSNDTKLAETWYKKAIAAKYFDPIATLYYADMLKANEKYELGIVQYNAYKALEPTDTRGEKGAESCALAQQWKDNPVRYEIENMTSLNTKDMDFAPTYADRKFKSLIFTSTREGSTGMDYDSWTGQSFADLYLSAQDKRGTTWSSPVSIGENVNTKFNEGSPSLNDKCNEMYFTRCTFENKKQLNCQINSAKKKGTSWDIPEPITLGPDSFTYGDPHLSGDELTLYFSSDMAGGYGGKDLWVAKRSKKTKAWETPVNLGPNVNTEGDERFPFLRDDGVLYFASNGHIGMGGLDIYKVEKISDDKWNKPVNMKYPINSCADDFSIIFEDKVEKGFLSSNRKGGKGSDDIYSFYLPPLVFTLKGTIYDDSSKTTPKDVLKGALVTLTGSDGTVATDSTLSDGTYKFDKTKILPNTSYQITVTFKDYFGGKKKKISTVGLENNKDFEQDLSLIPIPKKPVVLPEILYEFNAYDLKPEFEDSLNGLFQTMQDEPKLVIELGSHTDTRGSDVYNDSLSYKRAKSVVDYLISKGIHRARLKAKGYGESTPRTLLKDITVSRYYKGTEEIILKTPITFSAGTVLTEEYINKFAKDEKKFESAHQLNRRTEFKILSNDFVASDTLFDEGAPDIQISAKDTTTIKKDEPEDDNNSQPENNNITPDKNKENKTPQNNKTGTTGTNKTGTTGTNKTTPVRKK